jgi:hypothetical protein
MAKVTAIPANIGADVHAYRCDAKNEEDVGEGRHPPPVDLPVDSAGPAGLPAAMIAVGSCAAGASRDGSQNQLSGGGL